MPDEVKRTLISKRVENIFRNYYTEQAEQKTDQLIAAAHHYVDEVGLPDQFCVQASDILISKLVNSYILDVIRFKEYHFSYNSDDSDQAASYEAWEQKIHGEKAINNSKKASFTAKWILKTSPILIHNTGDSGDRSTINKIYTINEVFAVRTAYKQVEIEFKEVPQEILKDTLYNFRFRNFDEYWFASNLEILERFYKNG